MVSGQAILYQNDSCGLPAGSVTAWAVLEHFPQQAPLRLDRFALLDHQQSQDPVRDQKQDHQQRQQSAPRFRLRIRSLSGVDDGQGAPMRPVRWASPLSAHGNPSGGRFVSAGRIWSYTRLQTCPSRPGCNPLHIMSNATSVTGVSLRRPRPLCPLSHAAHFPLWARLLSPVDALATLGKIPHSPKALCVAPWLRGGFSSLSRH